MLGFEQVVEVTREEARDEILELLDEVGFAATSWQEGSIPLALVEIGAWVWSKGTEWAVTVKKNSFNETAEDAGLDSFSRSHYQNTFREARAEQHLVTLTCADDEGPHTIEAGAFQAKNTNGYTFTNALDELNDPPVYPTSYPLILPAGGSVQIILKADLPGDESVTALGLLNTIITTLTGVTMTDSQVLVSGTAKESNASLRKRNSLKWALLPQMGLIDDSVEALARDASEAVDRVYVDSTNPRGQGTLDVWITGAQGDVGTVDKTAVKIAIQKRIMHDPDGDKLQVYDAPLQALNITGTIYFDSSYDWDDEVLPAIESTIEAWRRTIPLGGFPYPSPGKFVPLNNLETVIKETKLGESGAKPVLSVKLDTPSADVAVAGLSHVTAGTWAFTSAPVVVKSE